MKINASPFSDNVALAGAAGGLAGNFVEQGLNFLSSGQNIDAFSLGVAAAAGIGGGFVASKFLPTRGRLPSVTKSRNTNNFGPNSKRLVGQEEVSGAFGAATGIASGDGGCECP